MRSTGLAVLLFVGLSLVTIPAWALDFKPGKYKITSKTEMPGMPMQIPPQTIVQCMTKNDPVPKQPDQGGCKMKDQKVKGNTVSWTMECNQQGQVTTGTGKMTYSGDTFSGLFTVTLGPQAGNTTMTTKMRGERIGPCN